MSFSPRRRSVIHYYIIITTVRRFTVSWRIWSETFLTTRRDATRRRVTWLQVTSAIFRDFSRRRFRFTYTYSRQYFPEPPQGKFVISIRIRAAAVTLRAPSLRFLIFYDQSSELLKGLVMSIYVYYV